MTATIVDVDALWHVAVYALLATVTVTGGYGTLVLALDRVRGGDQRGGALGWWALAALAALVCLAAVAVGLWAMTKK
jgi:hypothetical protein